MRTLDALRVPVGDCERAAAFFGAVFGWTFSDVRGTADPDHGPAAGSSAIVAQQAGPAGLLPSADLMFTAHDPAPGPVLCLSGSDPQADAYRVERLGGWASVAADAGTAIGADREGTPLRLGGHRRKMVPGRVRPGGAAGSRGVLGVIFVYVRDLDGAATFYRELCGWSFTAVGRDRDILFAEDGPPLGLRPADKQASGQTGAVGFHISVREPARVADDIIARAGQAGPPQLAGAFSSRPCRDDQGTAFSLWSD